MPIPSSDEPRDSGSGMPPEASIRIVEIDGDVVELAATKVHGEVGVITGIRQEGQDLILSSLHMDGPGAGSVGVATLRNLARVLGRHYNASRVIVWGGVRTTGANPGRVPRPIIIEVGDR